MHFSNVRIQSTQTCTRVSTQTNAEYLCLNESGNAFGFHQVVGIQRKRDSEARGTETYCLQIKESRFVLPKTEKSKERLQMTFKQVSDVLQERDVRCSPVLLCLGQETTLQQGRSDADTREKDILVLTIVKQNNFFMGKGVILRVVLLVYQTNIEKGVIGHT